MSHLPKQATSLLGETLRAKFDCSEQPLPANFEILLCRLDRRRRIQTRLKVSGQKRNLDRPLDVHWLAT